MKEPVFERPSTLLDILLILSVLPAALLFLLVYRNDSGHKESPGMLIKLFLFGCLSAPLAGSLEEAGSTAVSMLGIESYGQIMYDLVFYVLVVAVIEELVKFIFLFAVSELLLLVLVSEYKSL